MAKPVHLNLLRPEERVSSSPVRIRVMLPILMLLVCAGMLVWWAILFTQLLLVNGRTTATNDDLIATKNASDRVLAKIAEVNELEAELEQLDGYRASRRPWGGTLAALAEVMPVKIQLTRLEIPAPPPQNLQRPPGVKGPPLWGPATVTEPITMTLSGRTTRERPVTKLMESLETEAFTNSLIIIKNPQSAEQSPKVKSFRQDSATVDGQRLAAFEIEYLARGRRFVK